ncbi:hypothetical protein GGR50DRAFT_692750 [Xylaria sp. CBS 124048]|nr:hypothetical protein GGR50DRAFT_692750 [Xylaria sp. CBS 124048]
MTASESEAQTGTTLLRSYVAASTTGEDTHTGWWDPVSRGGPGNGRYCRISSASVITPYYDGPVVGGKYRHTAPIIALSRLEGRRYPRAPPSPLRPQGALKDYICVESPPRTRTPTIRCWSVNNVSKGQEG